MRHVLRRRRFSCEHQHDEHLRVREMQHRARELEVAQVQRRLHGLATMSRRQERALPLPPPEVQQTPLVIEEEC